MACRVWLWPMFTKRYRDLLAIQIGNVATREGLTGHLPLSPLTNHRIFC